MDLFRRKKVVESGLDEPGRWGDGNKSFIDNSYEDSEIFIGLIGAVGTDLSNVFKIIEDRLKKYNYECIKIRISEDVISNFSNKENFKSEFYRISHYMEMGNKIRRDSKDNSVMALASSARINEIRAEKNGSVEDARPLPRVAFVIQSIKHPEEVERLKNIYTGGFFLLGVHCEDERRKKYLVQNLGMDERQADELMKKDYSEKVGHGQHTSDAFHMSDFFVSDDGNKDKLERSVWRILDLIFGKPFITPTFDEYAMFMAFSASLRSADLSRQVGAVIAKNKNILATGANDVPVAGGGLYWPRFCSKENDVIDAPNGRDYMRGFDSNAEEKNKIITEIIDNISGIEGVSEEDSEKIKDILSKSRIKDITEFGRVVHAEMEALLSCSRNNESAVGATLYCTTFPCHNCAKHIISSGVKRVVYVQPYSKSKAASFHDDSIVFNVAEGEEKSSVVKFEPFIGIGPRSFFNLFSMSLGSGYHLDRKNSDGSIKKWNASSARLRMQLLPCSYIEREILASKHTLELLESINDQEQ